MSVSEMVWVKRNDGMLTNDFTARQAVEERLNSPNRWQSIVVFPEGTVHAPGVLTHFRPGPFLHGLPVQPVVYRFSSSEEWTTWADPDHPLLLVVFHTLCQFRNEIEVEYLPVYVPSDEEKEDADLYARNVRQVFADALGVPCTEHSCEDTLLAEHATTLGLPLATGCVEFRKLKDYYRLLNHFASLDGDKDGYVTERDFCTRIPWPFPKDAKQWFADCDTSSRGKISFREYVAAYGQVIEPLARDRLLLQDAFEVLSEAASLPSGPARGCTPRRLTAVSLKAAFGRRGNFVLGTQVAFHSAMCPDGQPCGSETFSNRVLKCPDLVVMLESMLADVRDN